MASTHGILAPRTNVQPEHDAVLIAPLRRTWPRARTGRGCVCVGTRPGHERAGHMTRESATTTGVAGGKASLTCYEDLHIVPDSC